MTSLFRSLLGDRLDRVPAPIRALHESPLPRRFEGRAIVRAAEGMIARWIARQAGLPARTEEVPIAVQIEPDGDGEIWTREFPIRTAASTATHGKGPMRSRLWRDGDTLCERLGPIELRFRLEADERGIVWHPLLATSGGTPAPAAFMRGIHAREYLREGRYAFDVGATLPWIGHIVAYDGWLDVD